MAFHKIAFFDSDFAIYLSPALNGDVKELLCGRGLDTPHAQDVLTIARDLLACKTLESFKAKVSQLSACCAERTGSARAEVQRVGLNQVCDEAAACAFADGYHLDAHHLDLLRNFCTDAQLRRACNNLDCPDCPLNELYLRDKIN